MRIDGTTSQPPEPALVRGRELAASILAECERTQLAPGARLPTERQLAAQLGVTRTSVRNALGLLEAEGRVSREVGRGTFLRSPDGVPRGAGPGGRPDDLGPADVMAARETIEPRILPLVVAWASARDFAEIERCLAGGEGAAGGEEFEAWDLAFHHALVVATHNPLLVRMYEEIESARRGELWGSLKLRNDSVQRRASYQRDHREIVDALRSREVERAVEAMRSHLERVAANLLGTGAVPPGEL
jgi:GntR family uxuAB operon transcriptional repressor